MKKEEYINKVLLHIKNKAYLATVKNELEGHISDRENYYIEIGYDNETATVKAMEHMGDADLLGEKMNRLHHDKTFKVGHHISIIIAAAIYFSYVIIFDDYLNLGAYSALGYAYKQDAIYLFIAASLLVCMTVSYSCALKTRQSHLMFGCANTSVLLNILTAMKAIDSILPLADFKQAIEEIKGASSITTIYNNYEIYEFLFAVVLSLCLIITFVHGVSAALCSHEFKAFEKGNGNMAIINRFDSYRKIIIPVSVIFSVICVVDSVLTIRMFI